MIRSMMAEVPLRTLTMFGGDALNRGMAEGLLLMINRQMLTGLRLLLRSRKKK